MKFTSWHRDITLVAITSGLSALIATTDPLTWRALLGVILSMAIAIRAKLSPDKKHEPEPVIEPPKEENRQIIT